MQMPLPHNSVLLDALIASLPDVPGIRRGKMFGHVAFYLQGKMFACLYENQVGLKLPAHTVQDLVDGGAVFRHFRPYRKPPMKEWIAVDESTLAVLPGGRLAGLLAESMRFVCHAR